MFEDDGKEDGVEAESEEGDGDKDDGGLLLRVDAGDLQREPDGDEPFQGHGHQDPAGQNGEEIAGKEQHLQLEQKTV